MARARVAFVTGGGKGIGRACAARLAREGLAVAIGCRTEADGRAASLEITRAGGAAMAVRLDVSDPESVHAAFESAETALGPVDVLVCAAGVSSSAKFLETDAAAWREALAVNLMGPVHCARAVLHGMIERNFGRIVVIGSTASLEGAPYVSAYTASKHGVLGFVRALAAETARKDITVNAVCPGFVDTPMTAAAPPPSGGKTRPPPAPPRAARAGPRPPGRRRPPEEVADAVAWLVREDAGAVNGQAVVL